MIPKKEWPDIAHVPVTHGDIDHFWSPDQIAVVSNAFLICGKDLVRKKENETYILDPLNRIIQYSKKIEKAVKTHQYVESGSLMGNVVIIMIKSQRTNKFILFLQSGEIKKILDMLIVNGSIDFSTPPQSLNEIEGYYHNAQMVILPEFSHVGDVESLQPEAFERMVTSYYATGIADASLFENQPLSFSPNMSMVTLAKIIVAGLVILSPLLIAAIIRIIRRKRKSRSIK